MARASKISGAAFRRSRAIAEWRGYAEPRPVLDRVQPLSALVGKGLAGYVLGHSAREWPLAAKLSGLRGGTVVAGSDHGSINAPLAP